MTDTQLLARITADPGVMAGKPVIRGTRLAVEYVVKLLAHGATAAEILAEYQGLTADDIAACLLFASKSLEETDMPSKVKIPDTDMLVSLSRKELLQRVGLGFLSLLIASGPVRAFDAQHIKSTRESVAVGNEYENFPSVSLQASSLLLDFLSHSKLKGVDISSTFDIDPQLFSTINRKIGVSVSSSSLDFIRGESAQHLSSRLAKASESILGSMNKKNANLVSYVYAATIVNWVRCHIFFDARDDSARRQDTTPILDRAVPATVCGGSSWLCAELAAYSGKTNLLKVEGRLRGSGAVGPPDHSWELLRLSSGAVLFADAQHSRLSLSTAIDLHGNLSHPLCFGTTKEIQALFLADRYEMNEVTPVVNPLTHSVSPRFSHFQDDPFSTLSIEQWASINTEALDDIRKYRPKDIYAATWQ